MTYYQIVLCIVTLYVLACSASAQSSPSPLKCFNCTGVTHMDACRDKIECGPNEVCYKQSKYSGQFVYELGCIHSEKCGDFADLPSGISKMDNGNSNEQTQPCFECCSTNRCNINLCQSKDPDVCVDDKNIDCAFLNSLFNLCKDVNQAKKVCPKYCKLCQVVDGNWTPWSNWSNCDVTCESGTQIRTRSCTDPPPEYGGLDCWGNDTEIMSCHMEPCPIHGGWNTWSTWSECSVSCDIGMQHRDRSCTNPRPSLFGDHCFGDSRDYRICMPGACTDGGWTAWGNWSACSESCAGGIMSRNRTCSNPEPSMTGKQCLGNSEQVSPCSQQACEEQNVAFTAYSLFRLSKIKSTLRFQKTFINDGNGYNVTTGNFTCHVPGVYHFVVVLSKHFKDIDYVTGYLRINGATKLYLHFDPQDNDSNELGSYSFTAAGTFRLDQNDVVDVYGYPNNYNDDKYSSFSGFLLTRDQ